jgi:tellurite resistance-related uncharacterized protein
MKKLAFIFIILLAFVACDDPGVTSQELTGEEANLPDVLKGLKVYSVSTGEGGYVKVAILNGEVNSVGYSEGKTSETTIIINPDNYNMRTIHAKEIVYETNEVIVVRK